MRFIFEKTLYSDRLGGFVKIGIYTKKSTYKGHLYWDYPIYIQLPFYRQ